VGRLGDLGTIDDKYDVAISTAAPNLDHLVVDTIEDGEAVIKFLRDGQIGRANLLCLDKINSSMNKRRVE
jgi:structural maintenance of chromosome 4